MRKAVKIRGEIVSLRRVKGGILTWGLPFSDVSLKWPELGYFIVKNK